MDDNEANIWMKNYCFVVAYGAMSFTIAAFVSFCNFMMLPIARQWMLKQPYDAMDWLFGP